MVLEHLSEQEEEHLLEEEEKHLLMQEGVVWLQLEQGKQVASLLLKQEQKQQEVKTRCSKEKLHQDERREGFPWEDWEKLPKAEQEKLLQ